MGQSHEPEIPFRPDVFLARLGELEVVLGPHARPHVERIRAALIAAMAARDRGDEAGAVREIGAAMECLASLAETLDLGEAAAMRQLAATVGRALLRGDSAEARRAAEVIFARSGARWVERK